MLPLLLLAAEAVTPKPPAIDPAIAAEYWRNRTQVIELESALKAKMAVEKAIVDKMLAACGTEHNLTDDNGLKCVAKKKEEPKK